MFPLSVLVFHYHTQCHIIIHGVTSSESCFRGLCSVRVPSATRQQVALTNRQPTVNQPSTNRHEASHSTLIMIAWRSPSSLAALALSGTRPSALYRDIRRVGYIAHVCWARLGAFTPICMFNDGNTSSTGDECKRGGRERSRERSLLTIK